MACSSYLGGLPIRSSRGPTKSNYYAEFYHHRLLLPVLELHINEAIHCVPYSMYHTETRLKTMILGIHHVALTVVYCFLLWSRFVLYACNTTFLIHSLVGGIWVVSSLNYYE